MYLQLLWCGRQSLSLVLKSVDQVTKEQMTMRKGWRSKPSVETVSQVFHLIWGLHTGSACQQIALIALDMPWSSTMHSRISVEAKQHGAA